MFQEFGNPHELPENPLPPPRFVGSAELSPRQGDPWVGPVAFLAALLGRLPALGAWWNGEDWALLGRAAGLGGGGEWPARWLGRGLYWDLSYPLFGLSPAPHAMVRLLLFAGCAWLVTRLARQARLNPVQQLVAGLLTAATPLAFAPLYQGAGIQDLLAFFLALLAVERWLVGGRRNVAWATGLALLSILAREAGLGLPLLFLVFLLAGMGAGLRDRAHAWSLIFLLALAGMAEGLVVLMRLGPSPESVTLLGSLGAVATNSGVYGWWLLSPGPLLADTLRWPMTAAGLTFFAGWAWWGANSWSQGRRLPGLTLVAALLVLAPALPITGPARPAAALPAVAPVALAVASLVTTRRLLSRRVLVGAGVLVAAWSFWSMDLLLGQRNGQGLPADALVRATSLSWKTCRQLENLPLERGQMGPPALTMLDIPRNGTPLEMAQNLGPRWVPESEMHRALGGALGPQLVLGRQLNRAVQVDWVNALFSNPPQAVVLCLDGFEFKHWGDTPNATFFAALDDVARGRYERARLHLIRGSRLQTGGAAARETGSFYFDPSQMLVPPERVLAAKEDFIDWTAGLLAVGHSPVEVSGLQEVFLQLLVAATGQSLEQLTAGSLRLVEPGPGSRPAAAPPTQQQTGN